MTTSDKKKPTKKRVGPEKKKPVKKRVGPEKKKPAKKKEGPVEPPPFVDVALWTVLYEHFSKNTVKYIREFLSELDVPKKECVGRKADLIRLAISTVAQDIHIICEEVLTESKPLLDEVSGVIGRRNPEWKKRICKPKSSEVVKELHLGEKVACVAQHCQQNGKDVKRSLWNPFGRKNKLESTKSKLDQSPKASCIQRIIATLLKVFKGFVFVVKRIVGISTSLLAKATKITVASCTLHPMSCIATINTIFAMACGSLGPVFPGKIVICNKIRDAVSNMVDGLPIPDIGKWFLKHLYGFDKTLVQMGGGVVTNVSEKELTKWRDSEVRDNFDLIREEQMEDQREMCDAQFGINSSAAQDCKDTWTKKIFEDINEALNLV